ncbi:unnamed protein product, partial [Brenthis ino]
MQRVVYLLVLAVRNIVCSDNELHEYLNRTDPATRQIYEFAKEHPKPVGILTVSSGKFVEIRESNALNSDAFSNPYHNDLFAHIQTERIPERIVHAQGYAAFGYFEVTNDVSKYTKADVFNGVGKKTPVVVRFSTFAQNLGGSELAREAKGFSIKFYTKEGNLDIVGINFPVFSHRDPVDFPHFMHALKRNPKTNLFDFTARWDFATKKPELIHATLWQLSDYGIPNGWRKMNGYAVHTYEINNKNGDKYFVKFNFRSEQGLENLSDEVALNISKRFPSYFTRDLYNAIENKNYPSWTLEMDVMTLNDIKHLDYNPFELTRIWKKGTYQTVVIGRLVLDRIPDNFFRVGEQSAFNPGNLVPGIPGPMDTLFRSRRKSYRNSQIHRLTINSNRMEVNSPLYWKVYNRDGRPPVKHNMKDAPNYYQNSFNGPVPFINPSRPNERFTVYEANAVDLEPASYFYNHYLDRDQRERLINNTIPTLAPVAPEIQRRVIRLLTLTDPLLGREVADRLKHAQVLIPPLRPARVLKYKRRNAF